MITQLFSPLQTHEPESVTALVTETHKEHLASTAETTGHLHATDSPAYTPTPPVTYGAVAGGGHTPVEIR